jgi:uncharacterized glyoxalase superfamily protein PhnB
MNNRSVPTSTLLPHLAYRSLPDACEWLQRVCGFKEQYRYGNPVSGIQMHLGDAYIMLTGRRPETMGTESPAIVGRRTQALTVFVADVDAHFDHAKREGATIWEDLHETVYGERQYGLEDLDGHRWLFSQHARDVDPAEWGAICAHAT